MRNQGKFKKGRLHGQALAAITRLKNDKRRCQKCEIIFGADGADTLELDRTRVCQRCWGEIMTGKQDNHTCREQPWEMSIAPVFSDFGYGEY